MDMSQDVFTYILLSLEKYYLNINFEILSSYLVINRLAH